MEGIRLCCPEREHVWVLESKTFHKIIKKLLTYKNGRIIMKGIVEAEKQRTIFFEERAKRFALWGSVWEINC